MHRDLEIINNHNKLPQRVPLPNTRICTVYVDDIIFGSTKKSLCDEFEEAPYVRYETLSTYLIENGFRRGFIDKTLFIKKDKGDILLVQVYVDDIIFGSTKKSLCDEFKGMQVQQKEDGIFISQDKYVADILKKFDFITVKTARTLIETNKGLVKDEEAEAVDVHLYRSMIGSLMYLTASRPDIIFGVCACARDSPFILEAFSDSDYAGASSISWQEVKFMAM
ncbi:putative ribonuclease H-like domain-containing protein [Tanacetum coccineum]